MRLFGRKRDVERTPIVDRNGVQTHRWKRARVSIDSSQPVPPVRPARPEMSPAQTAAHDLQESFESGGLVAGKGNSMSHYFSALTMAMTDEEGARQVERDARRGNKVAQVMLAIRQAQSENREYAASLLASLAQSSTPLGAGRLRAAFDLGNGWVVKVAPSLGGESANAEEASWTNRDLSTGDRGVQGERFNDRHPDYQLAECALVQATPDTSILLMRKVDPMSSRNPIEVPYWALSSDNAPDGVSKQIGTLDVDGTRVVVGYDL